MPKLRPGRPVFELFQSLLKMFQVGVHGAEHGRETANSHVDRRRPFVEFCEKGGLRIADALDEALLRRSDAHVQSLFRRVDGGGDSRVQPLFHRLQVLLQFAIHALSPS